VGAPASVDLTLRGRWWGLAGESVGYFVVCVIGVDSTTRLLAGRYVLERVLGRGGMAMVYAARDRRLDRQVAVKVVPVAVTEPVGRARFVREARSAAGLSHPNAVAVFDAGEADGYLFIVMELVEGRSLANVLAEAEPLEPSRATAIAVSVLSALAQAHAAGIVHRDVKPSNIMVSYGGVVKLLDFGIARRLDDLAGEVTADGEIVGTPAYLAPEQIVGRPTSPATDVYAVGVVLFEMLAGVAPFNGDSPVATALAHATAPVPDVRSLRPDVPAWLAMAIGKAMAKVPADRFADAAGMYAALTNSAADSTVVLRSSAVVSEPTQVLPSDGYRRRRRPWWLVGVAALAVASLVAWSMASELFSFITSGDPPEQRSAQATPTTSPVTVTTAVPTTIGAVIAALQANPDAYGRLHTTSIIDELVLIEQGDAPSERAANLLDSVAEWVEVAEVTPATLTLLERVLTPLIDTPVADEVDDGGNGNGNGGANGNGNGGGNGNRNGNGNGNGTGNGNGNGNGNANGHGKKD
jgi:serine/threonine protein kinase